LSTPVAPGESNAFNLICLGFLFASLPVVFLFGKLGRNAFIGFTSSVISDTCSNSLRVIKTTKQTHKTPITYMQAIRLVVDADGVAGLFGRGLRTRIIANGFQGLTFSVIWKALEEQFNRRLDAK
jgi:Mitochondrial carrier protein